MIQAGSDDEQDGGKGKPRYVNRRGLDRDSARALCFLASLPHEPHWMKVRTTGTKQVVQVAAFAASDVASDAPDDLSGGFPYLRDAVANIPTMELSPLVRTAALPAPLAVDAGGPLSAAAIDEWRHEEVVVTVKPDSTPADESALGRDFDLEFVEAYVSAITKERMVLYKIRGNRPVEQVIAALSTDSRVIAAQPNFVYRLVGGAATKLAMPQYAPGKIRLGEAHAIARGRKVTIAVIDTAVEQTHSELVGAIAKAYDAVGDGQSAAEAHGTGITGVIAARASMTGVAPEASVLSVASFRTGGAGPAQSATFSIVKGLGWAFENAARLFNMSFAGPNDPRLGREILSAIGQGAIIVAAAGNGGASARPAYPAAYPGVIAVSATDGEDRLYTHANRGPYIAIAAPGVDILAPSLGQSYEVNSGTSLAAPHVTGVVALLLERNPDLKPDAVRSILTRSARAPAIALPPDEIGAGVIDAASALAVEQ
jgi:subtilisin family serine protease